MSKPDGIRSKKILTSPCINTQGAITNSGESSSLLPVKGKVWYKSGNFEPDTSCGTLSGIPRGKPQLRRCMMAEINVGDKAPDFTLSTTLEDKMSLSDVLKDKKAVLVFYLFDFAGDMEGL